MKLPRLLSGALLVVAIHALTGLASDGKKDDAPFVVPVSKPVQRSVTDFMDYTGRATAKESVTIQPRVTGFLNKIAFKEGTEVKAGDVLFELDPRPYQAQADAAKAKVAASEAGLRYAKANNARYKDLAKAQPNAVSGRELDQHQAKEEEAVAVLQVAKANLEIARLNLDWTIVRAPIAGRVGRSNLTIGNLVKQDETQLTTLDSTDPMFVYFEVDERTILRLLRARKDARTDGPTTVLMRLADEDGYPHRGTVDFVDSRVNVESGSVRVRAVLANPKEKDRDPLLKPGMFVRVRLPIGKPHEALLVIDRAIITDQGAKFVWVVDAGNKVELRRISVGPLQDDGLRVVEQGLKMDDTVVIGGLQRLKARMKIQPDLVAMPTAK